MDKVKKAFRGKKNKIKPLDDTCDSGLSSSINNTSSVSESDCESNVRTGITGISRELESITVNDTPCCDALGHCAEYFIFLKSLQELGGSLKTPIEDVYNLMKERQQSTAYMELFISRGKLSRFLYST